VRTRGHVRAQLRGGRRGRRGSVGLGFAIPVNDVKRVMDDLRGRRRLMAGPRGPYGLGPGFCPGPDLARAARRSHAPGGSGDAVGI